MGYSIRTDRFRYTEWRDWKSGKTIARELYDHVADPSETKNVADEINRASDVEKCAALLEGYHPAVSNK
jgi:iduronate 2-sulfatase